VTSNIGQTWGKIQTLSFLEQGVKNCMRAQTQVVQRHDRRGSNRKEGEMQQRQN
jgi:hypothetical protein